MLSLLAPAGGALAGERCALPSAEAPRVRLAGLDASGDMLLADGRRIRLVGLAPQQSDAEAARFAAALKPWQGRDLLLVAMGEADRWGRLPARLIAATPPPQGEERELSLALLRGGAAWHLPDSASAGCDAALRIAESAAMLQAQKEGENHDHRVDGHDIAALKVQAGRITMLEGRIASIGERPQRSYLNFSRRRGAGAAVVVSRRLWREMQEVGWTARSLTGKRVRARGVLSGPDGLSLELPSLAALELID